MGLLAQGIISNPNITKEYVNDAELYVADGDKYVSSIFLINTSSVSVTFTLTVLYDNEQIHLDEINKVLAPGVPYELTRRLFLSQYNKILVNTPTDNVIQYIINGGNAEDSNADISISVGGSFGSGSGEGSSE